MITTRLFAAAAGAALLSLGFPASAAEPAHHVYALGTQSNSGELGTVTLIEDGKKTRVEIAIANAPAGPQPAHIHAGTCSKLDPKPKYPLTSVVDGLSTTTVDVPMAELIKGGLAVNVHKSTSDLATYVACGDLGK